MSSSTSKDSSDDLNTNENIETGSKSSSIGETNDRTFRPEPAVSTNSMYIAHITLSLDNPANMMPLDRSNSTHSGHLPSSYYPTWRYITIRRNPLANSIYNFRYKLVDFIFFFKIRKLSVIVNIGFN